MTNRLVEFEHMDQLDKCLQTLNYLIPNEQNID